MLQFLILLLRSMALMMTFLPKVPLYKYLARLAEVPIIPQEISLFFHYGKTEAMLDAIDHIEEMNKLKEVFNMHCLCCHEKYVEKNKRQLFLPNNSSPYL
ncbi:hypothetical protein KHA80_12950 [Anaerobacillus sp. HL2]|nr:hypothetical protein KHA80_12950 [Anaerobacillus sp. HL2]